jgi:hypothetical protein
MRTAKRVFFCRTPVLTTEREPLLSMASQGAVANVAGRPFTSVVTRWRSVMWFRSRDVGSGFWPEFGEAALAAPPGPVMA